VTIPGSTAEDYLPVPGSWDEAVDAAGAWRPHARAVAAALEGRDLEALRARLRRSLAEGEVTFNSVDGSEEWPVDPVPRVIPAAEWEPLAAGLAQRVRALDAFTADLHGPRRAVADGVVPARVIETAEYAEPELRGLELERWIGLAGLDVVRDGEGRLRVLEDNCRTPSGAAYAVACRLATLGALGPLPGGVAPRELTALPDLFRSALRGAAPPAAGPRPRAVLLSDGPGNSAWWEHRWLAEAIGIPLVCPDEVEVAHGRLRVRADRSPIDVVYRRTDADRFATDLGRLLAEPLRAGTLGMVNAFGTGVADDKLAHAYVEDMIRFYLREEPLVRSVPTYDLAVPARLEEALDRFEELVVKPRSGHGGVGVLIAPLADRAEVEAARAAVRADPAAYVAQEVVRLSTVPTVVGGRLVPRHVDLRPFVFLGADDEARVLPGGLTRVALDEGELIVNSSQNGGAKDTWVLDA
jgi:uncharacterized circularly permuted ATP-grasp superfamily protein